MANGSQVRSTGRAVVIGRAVIAGALLGLGVGCAGGLDVLGLGADDAEIVAVARSMADGGDLPGAHAEYERLLAEHPGSVGVAVGQAYLQMLGDDLAGADATLAAALPSAGDAAGAIHLRRALLALRWGGRLDDVRDHAEESGLPAGALLAAEVYLVDLEHERAAALLRDASDAPGAVGQVAAAYLDMMDSGDLHLGELADATALWALGERQNACEAAESPLIELTSEHPDRDALLLLWAGRAVTSGLPAVARRLVDMMSGPPVGQAWRLQATDAMVLLSEGKASAALGKFASLRQAVASGDVPADGLADALATACAISKDADTAMKLVQGVESAAAAKCLLRWGDAAAAIGVAPDGPLRSFLEGM